jgi:glycosyltransferase involved in cell wall biosynthesis
VKLSIIMAVYNESNTVREIFQRVLEADVGLDKELIIVDDGSTDGTWKILTELEQEHRLFERHASVKIVMHERNKGKGSAIRTGLQHSTGDIILIQDADLEYDPQDYPTLLRPILSHGADVVFGNRFHGGSHRVLYFWHYVGNRVLTTLSNILTNLNLNDMEVGYKVFRRDILSGVTLRSRRFGFEPEITVKVARRKCRIYEVPISYHGRTYAEGKKITWRDGFAALYSLVRYRFFD